VRISGGDDTEERRGVTEVESMEDDESVDWLFMSGEDVAARARLDLGLKSATETDGTPPER